MRKLIIFDLDGTLATSKSSIDPEMSALLHDLLGLVKVAIISGGDWIQFKKQVLSNLPSDNRLLNLLILPTCGTKFYHNTAEGWCKVYSEDLKAAEKDKIVRSIKKVIQEEDFKIDKVWGEQIEDRGSQITFSALGQKAPLNDKEKWDPNLVKRQKMKEFLATYIPEFSVKIGGETSIDVTKHGIDKAYGIKKLRDILGITIDEMIFIGDALFSGGNDYPAIEAGVVSIRIKNPKETKLVIETIVACMDNIQHKIL